jgi:hypothetical protein
MRILWNLFAAVAVLALISLPAAPAQAQGAGNTAITASPTPATSVDEITLTATGRGACPFFGPVTVEEQVIRVELRTSCPFTPPPPEPFTLNTTIDPLEPGIYELRLVLPNNQLLATGQLEVLDKERCVPSATVLCLHDNRFQVEVDFRAANGNSGQGKVIELTEESGLFTFFSATNVELIVKVLNRCNSAFNSFWVFSAGLTNVEVDVTITDTDTEVTKTYHNPLGKVFGSVLDTRALNTCP